MFFLNRRSAEADDAKDCTYRVFPNHKIACIPQAKITSLTQTFSDVASFAQLTSRLILLFLCSANFTETNFDIRGELKGGSMEGASLLL